MKKIDNFYEFSDRLASGGQPTEEQLKEIAAEKYELVINLGLSDQPYSLANESNILKALGVNYYHIPVLFDNPTLKDLRLFFDKMQEKDGRKVFVHCAANHRASTFAVLYFFYNNEIKEDEIFDLLYEVWAPDKVWQLFIEESIEYIRSYLNQS